MCGFRKRSIVDGVDCRLTAFVESVSSAAVRFCCVGLLILMLIILT